MIDPALLEQLEVQVAPALRRGERPEVEVIGWGEISVVLGLEHEGRRFACKRMPPFPDEAAVTRYREVCARYATVLQQEVGLALPQHEVLRTTGGARAVYYVQQGLPAEGLVDRLLHQLPAGPAAELLEMIMTRVAWLAERNRARRPVAGAQHAGRPLSVARSSPVELAGPARRARADLQVGLDGQVSNWVLWPVRGEDRTLWYIDTSTPLLKQEGRQLLDVGLLLSSLPAPLVPLVRLLFLKEILGRYHDPRQILRDLLGNLIKERLEHLLPPGIERVNALLAGRLGWLGAELLTEDEVRRYYRSDARMWALLQRLRRLDRAVKRLLRRPYPFLLPDRIER